jgi:hypothetical protein
MMASGTRNDDVINGPLNITNIINILPLDEGVRVD